VTDDIINANACYTIATQAHSTESGFVNLYKQFVQNGGNLVLQCASINTFENDANGHFQTTLPGYSVFGTNDSTQISTPHVYPEGSMPFNQFIGILGDQDGAITDYAYAPGGGPANGNRVSVRNTTGDEADPTIDHSNKFVATVSQLLGPGLAGGAVFALGGHDYDRGNASAIENINGRRMVLNALFVPVTRPNSCGLNQANVLGFKSVRRLVDLDGGPLGAGDTVRWTIDYINNSPIDVTDFQIRDIVRANLTLVPGSNQVTGVSANSIAARNPLYDGIGDDASSDLLAGGGLLKAGGRITVIVDMIINPGTPSGTVMANQTSATGTGVVTLALSDNIDATNTSIFGPGVGPPPGSILQNQNPASIDPTTVTILAPSAADASIDGMVRDSNGIGINKAVITIVNAETSETRRVMTNAFGYYIATDLQAGDVHVVSVSHKRYSFPTPSFTFTLNDNVSGLTFVAGLPDSRGSR
ncbi:MAG: carboxypeptidase regulatory-like domain-containing protein, partial [Saprospiraceae bacterium]|nr:carboxypeptidase regulatory-like domain-containing protein [Pyrinomonadaceae bacterium]